MTSSTEGVTREAETSGAIELRPASSQSEGPDQKSGFRPLRPPRFHPRWSSGATASDDYSIHQIAPYIGRMKASIARSLVESWTSDGDLIVDPFCGCGTVAVEAAASRRGIIAGDWNPYAALLTRAKLFPPLNPLAAEVRLQKVWKASRDLLREQDFRKVPKWVRQFFHPRTLRSALAFRDACVDMKEDFILACFLGILHHQRPGFLSYPSSHLVPYLRDQKYPRSIFPQLYEERDVLTRMQAKVRRTLERMPNVYAKRRRVLEADSRQFPTVRGIQAVITSPPYMNELDYVRDNRLRLWFLMRSVPRYFELSGGDRERAFTTLLQTVCLRLASAIEGGGYCILVLGDAVPGGRRGGRTAAAARALFETHSGFKRFRLKGVYHDTIPDIRRSRRECRGTKQETVLVYQKVL